MNNQNNRFHCRPVDKESIKEMRFIAEMDSRIPLEYDSTYIFDDSSIDFRLQYYSKLKPDDFFEVIEYNTSIVAFHIVSKFPYPPNFFAGNISTLWVHPDHRNKGLAKELKSKAETWAKDQKLIFIQTNVSVNNKRMLKINESNNYKPSFINMRKDLR
jgi:GNAT superfamily N-acetyltransferase